MKFILFILSLFISPFIIVSNGSNSNLNYIDGDIVKLFNYEKGLLQDFAIDQDRFYGVFHGSSTILEVNLNDYSVNNIQEVSNIVDKYEDDLLQFVGVDKQADHFYLIFSAGLIKVDYYGNNKKVLEIKSSIIQDFKFSTKVEEALVFLRNNNILILDTESFQVKNKIEIEEGLVGSDKWLMDDNKLYQTLTNEGVIFTENALKNKEKPKEFKLDFSGLIDDDDFPYICQIHNEVFISFPFNHRDKLIFKNKYDKSTFILKLNKEFYPHGLWPEEGVPNLEVVINHNDEILLVHYLTEEFFVYKVEGFEKVDF